MTDSADRASGQSAMGPGANASGPTASSGVPVVELRNLSKSFGGSQALKSVDLTILPGEVHGLLGENGSGKSTLIKILNGFHAPDPGAELKVNGEDVSLPLAPGQFRDLGLSFVHQDLGLVLELTVLENLRVGELIAQKGAYIPWRAERRKARETFKRFNVELDPSALVTALTPTERALLAIIRAVEEIRSEQAKRHSTSGLLILDEPTVFLPQEGTEALFGIVRNIVASGDASVLFVSHDLDEVREVTDRVTVLRDGLLQGTVDTAQTSEAELVQMIIGRRLDSMALESQPSGREIGLSVKGLAGGVLQGVDLEIRRGEIVGITGLMGSGFEDIPYFLFGARPCSEGSLSTNGVTFDLKVMSPDRAVANGFALLPADRQRDGSVPDLTVGENVMLQVLPDYKGPYGLKRRPMRKRAHGVLGEFDVRPPDPALTYESLSGGNQQKALLAKWLQSKPEVIFLHEPTQGVDIGARAQIFAMLGDAAHGDGACILCASSDYEQLAAICDRVIVLARGRVIAEISGTEVTKDRIGEQVYNSVTLRESTMEAAG
jgi:ribose transport system ATP-binding protein